MIPPFDDSGYLPPGLHVATLEEVAERFGSESEIRRVQMESLGWLVDIARCAGVRRLVVNGSFVTDVLDPNDVDCALLIDAGFPLDAATERELSDGPPFLQIDLLEQADFDLLIHEIYATDRQAIPKGMIEVVL